MARVDTSGVAGDVRGRIQRTEAYAEQVRKMFAATVNAILTLKVTPPDIDNGEMYSFDGQSIRIRQQVEQLLRKLHSVVVLAIEKGISLEWDKAQEASNDLLKRVYGSRLLNSNVMRGWNSRNNAAQEEFIKRSDRGMNLSQRVWKSCRQLRDEMEVALTVSIGEGEDAGTISRRVRQYLNDPDLMFRRFRYKIKEPLRDDKGNYILDKNGQIQMVDKLDSAGNPIWGRKWKKKVIDHATGKVTFIDYDKDSYHDQWTGKGYYKSAAQNAMRVARTETNIAYRRSDCERWKQLDFVLGMRVELSHNHPEYDICDELKGDYPKDFIFDGWHPQCFCHAVPILVDPSEMRKRNEAIARGEEYTPKGTPVTDVPKGFKDWCIENQDKILASRVRGTEPYFVRNNFGVIDQIINPQNYKPAIAADIDGNETPALTTLQIAERRRAARTPEYIAEVKERWEQHRRNEVQKALDNLQGKEWIPMSEISKEKDDMKRLKMLLQNCDLISASGGMLDDIRDKFAKGTLSGLELSLSVTRVERYYLYNIKGMDVLSDIRKMDVSKAPSEWFATTKGLVNQVNSMPLHNIANQTLQAEDRQALGHLNNIGKLTKDKTALFFGLENISTKTPQELFKRWISKDLALYDELPPKDFFENLKYYVRLDSARDGAQCVTSLHVPYVEISNEDRFKMLKGFRDVITHEYGHAYERMAVKVYNDMWRFTDTDLRKDFDAIKHLAEDKTWTDKVSAALWDEYANSRSYLPRKERLEQLQAEFDKAEEDRKRGLISKKECSMRQKYITDKIKAENDRKNQRAREVKEAAMTLDDIVQSMRKDHKQKLGFGGHDLKYFFTPGKDLGEFIAHCSEFRYMDFEIIKKVAPEIYNLMQKYAKKYWGV